MMMQSILSAFNLQTARKKVIKNKGCAGIDKMEVSELEEYYRKQGSALRESIQKGTYKPQAVLGVEIPKSSGGTRLLGIPTVTDRMIQQAIHQYLSPRYEPEFSKYSYAYRPQRSAHQAATQALAFINEGYQWIINMDLKNFFDMVNHDILMSILNRKITDPLVMKLIRLYLQSGIMLDGLTQQRESGTPQGSPLSPLLSNIYLNELDKELTRRNLRFTRYADDVNIYVKTEKAAKRVLISITKFIEGKLRLQVNREKTSICRPVNFNMLGFAFVPTYKKDEKGKYQIVASQRTWNRFTQRIKEITRKTRPITMENRIAELNDYMNGWLQYFKQANIWGKLREADRWIRSRLRYAIWKQWKKPSRRRRAYLKYGASESDACAWSFSRKGGWAIAQSPIMKTTVTQEVLRKEFGYIPFTERYEKIRYSK